MNRKLFVILSGLCLATLILSACSHVTALPESVSVSVQGTQTTAAQLTRQAEPSSTPFQPTTPTLTPFAPPNEIGNIASRVQGNITVEGNQVKIEDLGNYPVVGMVNYNAVTYLAVIDDTPVDCHGVLADGTLHCGPFKVKNKVEIYIGSQVAFILEPIKAGTYQIDFPIPAY